MVAYQATRQVQARLRALSAVNAVVLGATALTTRRLPPGAATTREAAPTTSATTGTTAAATMASALFATPTSVG